MFNINLENRGIPFLEINKDQDFSETIKKVVFQNKYSTNGNIPEKYNAMELSKLDKMDRGIIPPTPRKVISRVFLDENSYDIYYDVYDEFIFCGQKYLYAVKSDTFFNQFQIGYIINVGDDGKAYFINDKKQSEILIFYAVYYRLFNAISPALSQSALNLFKEVYRKEQDQIINKYPNNPTGELLDRCNDELGEIEKKYQDLEKVLKDKRDEHLTPAIIGYIKHGFNKKAIAITNSIDQVFAIDTEFSDVNSLLRGGVSVLAPDSKYEKYVGTSRYNVSTYDCKIKTPFNGYTIVDIVKIKGYDDRFVVLAFKRIKRDIDSLEKIPVYFLVEKNSNDLLDISIIPEDKLNYYLIDCGLIERFALKMTLIEKMFGVVFPE